MGVNLWPADASKAARATAIPAHAVRTAVRVPVPVTVQGRHAEACARRETAIRDAFRAVTTDATIHVRHCASTAVPARSPRDLTGPSEARATFPHAPDAHRTAVRRAAALHAPFPAQVPASTPRVPDSILV